VIKRSTELWIRECARGPVFQTVLWISRFDSKIESAEPVRDFHSHRPGHSIHCQNYLYRDLRLKKVPTSIPTKSLNRVHAIQLESEEHLCTQSKGQVDTLAIDNKLALDCVHTYAHQVYCIACNSFHSKSIIHTVEDNWMSF
jgi:hypothetical protein